MGLLLDFKTIKTTGMFWVVIGKVMSLNSCQVYKWSSYFSLHYVQFAISSSVSFFIHHSCQCPLEISSNYDYSTAGWLVFRQLFTIKSFYPHSFSICLVLYLDYGAESGQVRMVILLCSPCDKLAKIRPGETASGGYHWFLRAGF